MAVPAAHPSAHLGPVPRAVQAGRQAAQGAPRAPRARAPRVTVSSYGPTTVNGVVDRFFTRPDDYGKHGRRPKSVLILLIVGLVGLSVGLVMMLTDPYNRLFEWKATFGSGGEMFNLWEKPPVELYLRVWLWNVTNREEFLAGKEKLRVHDVGPYVYRERFTHEKVVFNENGTMTSVPTHPLIWVPELSEGHSENDTLILPNIALLSFSNVMADASVFTRLAVNVLIRQTDSQPLVEMTAREFMFGYESPLVTLGNKFMPSWIMFEKLGLIDRMYDFAGDFETDFTGETDVKNSGLIDKYNGRPYLPHWRREEGDGPTTCSNVRFASDGTKFNSYIEPNQTLSFFRKSMCRAMPMVRVGEAKRSGMMGYKYTFKSDALDNGKVNKDNKCFCRQGHCLPEGLIDVTDCYYGFPIAVGYPHFYKADPAVINAIEGVYPDERKHETHFIIEPVSGMPLEVAVRNQINMALGDLSNMAHVTKFSHMVLPLLHTEIGMKELPSNMQVKFIIYMVILPVVTVVLTWVFLVGGLALIGVCLVAAFCNPCRPDVDVETRRNSRAWLQQDTDVNKAVRKQMPELLIVEAERHAAQLKHGMAREREMQVYRSLLAPDDGNDVSGSSNASSRRTSFEQAYC
ncbi:scavenger receptor class B member 1-like isoform X1 [Thrips palmi]|uniref:Scavenger receptor class B member 1-like isoform X1 n=1 Tax=Thrips palmi TaxID=161013 RepID=A0A6P8ZRG8_THRPL|nr:scavenger receptor class B member 1-like isoform X1 [Thrips palmi]